VNVVCRTAAVAAVERILFLVKLRQRRLNERGRGADERRDPHPEHRACAPAETAATTPTMLPMPTRVAVETMSACRPDSALDLPPRLRSAVILSISRKKRTGRHFVRMVKYRPVGMSSSTRSGMPTEEPPGSGRVNRSPQRRLYTAEMIFMSPNPL